jgi:RHS repeat-associated protein
MQMPGRNASTGDYRYGFQGQETDDEITGSESHVSYKYRMHDARLGRFLSLDPLAPSYPHNSPYAFSENRVIDGVELEGLEYARIIYSYNNSTKPKITVEWHDDNQHNTYGDKGAGVLIVSKTYDAKHNLVKSTSVMHKRNAGIGGFQDHGFYYGPTQLPAVPQIADYELTSVDAVDEAGRNHDYAYDLVGATADNATKSWASIEADATFMGKNYDVISLGEGGADPFNGQSITAEEVRSARNALIYFEWTRWNKVEAVSAWMETHYSNIAKEGAGFFNDNEKNQASNYNSFRDIYMHQNSNGYWVENDGMWKTVGKGKSAYRAPLTKKELTK